MEEEIVLMSSMNFRYFTINPHRQRRGLSFEQTLIPIAQARFSPSLVKIGPVISEKEVLACPSIWWIFATSQLPPLGDGIDPSFEKRIPFTKGCFVTAMVETGPVVLEKKMKCKKFTDRRTTGDQNTSLEISDQVS